MKKKIKKRATVLPAGKTNKSSARSGVRSEALKRSPYLDFTVVGIGASAGGLEAWIDLFKAMPNDSGMAFVAIQHLAPDRKSMLAEILSRHTGMPVLQVIDGMKVQKNHVYVIQPGRTLTIRRGILRLGEPTSHLARRHPVDDFFRSLAEEQRERSIGVVMSGMGSNGTAGAQDIKAVGGLCIAQQPGSAQFPSMPQTLIDSGLADFILAPAEMPPVFTRYSVHPYAKGAGFTQARAGRERDAFNDILTLIRTQLGRDLSVYRKPTMVRRIARRMGLHQIPSMADYVRFLRQSPAEVPVLAEDLLINVTGFFRDPDVWRAIRSKVVEPLVAMRTDGSSVRAWVTACSTGEEAYSLAILLVEAAEAAKKKLDIKVFATDASEHAVKLAHASVFPAGIESDVSPERLAKFFEPLGASYRVRKELRERVVFAPQNVLQDAPFCRLDICTCRNFLIYLEPVAQKRVVSLLHFSLQEGGFLVLGNSENIAGEDKLFKTVDRKQRIFRRIGPTRHGLFNFPLERNTVVKNVAGERGGEVLTEQNVAQIARNVLLNALAPAAVAVDDRHRIVYFHGNTERFLVRPKGAAARDLMQCLRRPFRTVVRNAIMRSLARDIPCASRQLVTLPANGKTQVEIVVTPLSRTAKPAFLLISFSELPAGVIALAGGKGGSMSNRRLTRELRVVRDELQSTIDELQSNNEEMKAAHEETVSVNEEIQSSNEELETSKEELQGKMEELENSTNDIASLLSNMDIAVLFLDQELRIRKYTPAVRDLIELIDADIGRPLNNLAFKFTDTAFFRDIKSALKKSGINEAEVASNSGRTYVRRVRPYRKDNESIEGVVITFVDISARKLAELELRRGERMHRLILRGIKEYGIFVLDLAGRFVTWTAGAAHIFGYSEPEVLGKHLSLIHTEEDNVAHTAEKELKRAATGDDVFIERWQVRKDGSKFWGTGILSILNDESDRPYGFVKVVRDNTDRKLADEALRAAMKSTETAMKNAEAANASKDYFLANVSHELRTPLSATLLWAKLLSEPAEIDPQTLKEGLSAIARSAKEQQALIEDLMDTAKIVAGKLRLEPRYFELNAMLQTILPPIRSIAGEKNLVITEALDEGVGTVKADPRRIQQVVSNLLNNAVKFTPSGGQINVSTKRSGDNVEICVADNGKGIRREFLARIFDRFVQVDQGSTPTASGMGLGLAIVKQLVEMHGGTVVAESPGKDQGSIFTITVPLPQCQGIAEESWEPTSPEISLRGWRILLVEDSHQTRRALEVMLREAEAEVISVGTAQAALEEFDRLPPDLILSDIGLEGMDGHSLISEVRSRERSRNLPLVPAVALTAYADDKNIKKALESGFLDYATKPIEPRVLISKFVNLGVGQYSNEMNFVRELRPDARPVANEP